MSPLKHPLLWSAIVLGGLYTVFAYVLNPPIPQALLIWYMSICSVAVLLVVTFDNKTAARFFAPLLALFGAPRLLVLRVIAFAGVVAGVGYLTFDAVTPRIVSPVELRTVHPAPPSSLKAYGKTFDLLKLQNPYREQFDKTSDEYQQVVAEGAELYYKNCVFCHGDLLDGTGHFAKTFTPRPINFQDVGMIAQLQEAFLFWRITKGGPGLPREGTPWASAMPVWEEMLQEDEVWKIISFLYDYTGFEPRSWELEDKPKEPETAPVDPNAPLDADAIEAVYMKRCSQCHGEDGDGLGVAADRMYPAPRDFTLGLFKYKTTDADSEFPTDADFRKTIMEGLPGTAMPAWKTLLTDAEVTGLIQLIKEFGGWEEEDPEDLSPIEMGTPPAVVTPELLAQGRKQFIAACVQCHGDAGRGNITSGKRLKDDAQARIWPRNLTRPETWRWTKTTQDVFQRLSAGIPGTPMPEHTSTMSLEDRWAIANYVMTLRDQATPLTQGDSVIRGLRVDGDLPTDPADEIWNTAPSMTFAMAPNIIKEPRLFTSLNDMVTVRVLYNDQDIAFRVDMDDRTYSVPGSDLEKAYRLDGVEPTRDAVALQFPAALSGTNEKPYFRLGDKKNPVNLWYWAAPSEEPASPAIVEIRDAKGQNKAPKARADSSALAANGVWKDGQWRVVFKRPLKTDAAQDLQFEEGVYTPIAFADWDGLNGEEGLRQAFTAWYWVLLEPEENPERIMMIAAAAAALAGLLFIGIAIVARRRYNVA